jgi:protein SCO1
MLAPTSTRRSLLLLAALLAACDRPLPAPKFNGVDLTGAAYAQDFALTDAQGQMRRLADFKGKVLVVFFGFTQCPDVCPSTLGELRAVKEALGAEGGDVVPIFISVDPERDTPEILQAYGASFGKDFVMLRGSLEETQAVAKAFKAFFAKVPGKTEGSYTIDHTAASFLFDRQGKVRVYTRYGTAPAALQADLKTLLALK